MLVRIMRIINSTIAIITMLTAGRPGAAPI
jgi:hypothetical protein